MTDLNQQIADLRARIEALDNQAQPVDVTALENEARNLMAAARNTPHEAATRELFAMIARRMSAARSDEPVLSQPAGDSGVVRGLLRRARIRIELAGDEDDIDDAIDVLAEALDRDPGNPDTHELLHMAAAQGPMLEMKVRELLERYGQKYTPQAAETPVEEEPPLPPPVRQLDDLPPARPEPEAAPQLSSQPARPAAQSDATALISQLSQHYYAGNYQEAVDTANRVLEMQPDNPTALEYRQKAEDNILRGIVPDHRIPFDARVAYNRANSLVRAGNYDEAERLYREARDIAEAAGIPSWKDAEAALLEIQDLALARELQNEGDRLMAADDWQEAIRKYEGALRVVPNDPMAQDRLDRARNIMNQIGQAQARLAGLSGGLVERAQTLQETINSLAVVRQQIPSSTRLANLMQEANSRLQAIKSQLNEQSRGAMSRAENTMALDERLRLTTESVHALETAVELDPGDQALNTLLQEARQDEARMQEARTMIERAAALTAQNVDAELSQARAMLSTLHRFSQDPRYRQVVNDLMERFIDRVEGAVVQNDVTTAERWLSLLKDEPFRVLGRRTDLLRLETAVRGIRQRRRIRQSLTLLGLGFVGIILILFTRPLWEPPLQAIINPPTTTPTYTPTMTSTLTPTHTPTMTFTPSATVTPTVTPSLTLTLSPTITPSWTVTPSLTPTHTDTPTHTPTPTVTFTPSMTPTASDTPTITLTPSMTLTPSNTAPPPVLCRVFVQREGGVNVRSQPNLYGSRVVTVALQGTAMNVVQQRRGDDDRIWFLVDIVLDGAQVQGWILRELVVELTECPPPL
ncbi:MAG: hypothetical protein JXN59_04170 [Anaerolineae bacterium]|nr:hypothetical protein [Anaerolineae bacterium]